MADESKPQYAPLTEGPSPEGQLVETLTEIAMMLSYVGKNGIALPDDLRSKVDQLLNHHEVAKTKLFAAIEWTP